MPPKTKVSPLAPKRFPTLPPVKGVTLATRACAVRYKGRRDVLYAEVAAGTTVAGVFTRSQTASAPVDWCRANIARSKARALVVNAGNANAATGAEGHAACARVARATAKAAKVPAAEVYQASTGVIGEFLADDRITNNLPKLRAALKPGGWKAAAETIMTTDTFPKGASATAEIDGKTVTITGIAKGSGMIAPNMGTMLAFVFTDAALPPRVLQSCLKRGVDDSFNSITVDSDTSTSDTVLLFATGKGPRHKPVTQAGDPRLRGFREALGRVLMDLAHQVVRDGEGATKFVSVTVRGAVSRQAARAIGLTIANSPLVKTAIAGEDANWGRITMAIGKAAEKIDAGRVAIDIGGIPIARGGLAVPDYDEAPVAAHMKGEAIDIAVDVGVGRGAATVWTCDLTHAYIDINADYRS